MRETRRARATARTRTTPLALSLRPQRQATVRAQRARATARVTATPLALSLRPRTLARRTAASRATANAKATPLALSLRPWTLARRRAARARATAMIVLPRGCGLRPPPSMVLSMGVWARTRTLRRPSPRKESVGLAAAQDRSARGNDPAASRDRSDAGAGSTLAPAFAAKPRWARANNAGLATPRARCPDAPAHGSGEGDAPVASTDPSSTGVEAQAAQMEAKLKDIGNDEFRASSSLLGTGFLNKAVAGIVGGELHSRGLAAPYGFKPSAVKQEECDDLSGRPPS